MKELDSELIEQLFDRYLELDVEGVEDAAERTLAEAPSGAVREELRRQIDLDRRVLAAVPDVLDVNQRLGNYRLIEEIARGGQGIVYRAEQPSLGRDVAIKVLPPDRSHSREHRKKLAEESRLLGGLQHPAIVNAIELLATDRGLCLVMSYLPFPSMQRLLEVASKEGTAPLEILRRHSSESGSNKHDAVRLACHLFESAARGLDAAHRAGVLHGDVKPSNLLIGKDGHPYLIDFGLATLQGPQAEEGLRIHGTLPYVAPEILQRGQAAITPASDVYGLAATCYELLGGKPIFQADRFLELLRLAREEEVPRLRSRSRSIAPELDLILRRALDRDPEQRTQTALAFAEDLARFREGRALNTSGEPLGNRIHLAWRVAKQRHRVWIGAAVAALVLIAAAILLWPESNFGKALDALDAGRSESLVALLKSAREDGSFDSAQIAPRREALSRFLAESVAKKEIEDAHYYCAILRELGPLQEADERLASRLDGKTIVHAPLEFPRVRLMRSNRTGEFSWGTPALDLKVGANDRYLALTDGYWRVVFDPDPNSNLVPSYLIRCAGSLTGVELEVEQLWPYSDMGSVDWITFSNVRSPLGRVASEEIHLFHNPEGGRSIDLPYEYKLQVQEFSSERYQAFCLDVQGFIRRGLRPPFVHPDDDEWRKVLSVELVRPPAQKPLGKCSFYDAFAISTWAYARLPTEDEWEGAARSGLAKSQPYAFGWPPADPLQLGGVAPGVVIGSDGTELYRDVDDDPLPVSQHGLLHMYDNIGELTSTEFEPHHDGKPYLKRDEIVVKGLALSGDPVADHLQDGLVPAWARYAFHLSRGNTRRPWFGLRLASGVPG